MSNKIGPYILTSIILTLIIANLALNRFLIGS